MIVAQPPPGVAEVIAVASPATAKTATVTNTVAAVTADNPASIKVSIPRKVAAASIDPAVMTMALRTTFAAAATVVAKPIAPPPVSLTLLPTDPDSSDGPLCGPGCRGKISNVLGDFSHFNDRLHPIKVTLKVFVPNATTTTAFTLVMQKPDGSSVVTLASGASRQTCVKSGSGTAAHFNTPCLVGAQKVAAVKATATAPAGVTVQNVIQFTGADPKFALR